MVIRGKHWVAGILIVLFSFGLMTACQPQPQDEAQEQHQEEAAMDEDNAPDPELVAPEIPEPKPPEPVKEDPPEEKPPKEKPSAVPPANEGYIGSLVYDDVTGFDADGRVMVLNTNSILVLVNKQRNLSSSYAPKDLVKPDIRFSFKEDIPKRYLRAPAATALERLFQAASQAGHRLYAVSGYRSYSTQKSIFERNVARKGEEEANKTSARPGQSEHQTGLAMDISSAAVDFKLSTSFGSTPEGKWVRDHAHHYGFIIRYPRGKEGVTGYSYEPWHLRYVGTDAARYIYEHNLTLEEYFQKLYDYP